MRVFIICNRLCYGGAEHVGVTIANGLAERGHNVTIVANLFDEISYPVDKTIKLLNLYSSVDSQKDKWLGAIRLLRKYFKQNRPDIIIGIMWACSLRARIAALGLDIPVISTVHDSFERPKSTPMSRFEHFVKFQLNKIYPAVTVLTEADKKIIGRRLRNVVVMPNPLSTTPLSEENVGEILRAKQKVLLAVGRLDSWHVKGFDILIEAWSIVSKRQEAGSKSLDWKLQIAGKDEGGGLEYLQKLVKKYHVENSVEFLGFRKDIGDLFKLASVFVLSSRYEGFGLVLIEAMSQGCACIACDYKGRQKEILGNSTDSQNGILCKPENINQLSACMEKVMMDDELRFNIQKSAIQRSKEYLPSKIIVKWENLLNKILN